MGKLTLMSTHYREHDHHHTSPHGQTLINTYSAPKTHVVDHGHSHVHHSPVRTSHHAPVHHTTHAAPVHHHTTPPTTLLLTTSPLTDIPTTIKNKMLKFINIRN